MTERCGFPSLAASAAAISLPCSPRHSLRNAPVEARMLASSGSGRARISSAGVCLLLQELRHFLQLALTSGSSSQGRAATP